MSKKRWFFLWLLFIGYLFVGASIFFSIERDLEEERRRDKYRKNIQLQVILEEHIRIQNNLKSFENGTERSVDILFTKLSTYCARPLLRSGANVTEAEPYTWTYYNSFFFALTTLSTIGYGNLSPTSEQGKIWVIVYSLFGIPFNGIVLAHLGEFFGSKFLRAHHRYKSHTYESRISLIVDILIYLVPGMGVFILAPSIIFIYCENWTFTESIYYSFVTLTTIGYGDFVAGQTPGDSAITIIYQIFLLVWIMFGLGYLVMILGFISRAMRSKQINKLEKKVAQTLKHTQSKIWNEFIHDVHYLRRILNELYLMKVKPVYKETGLRTPVSQSCPNLSEWPVLRPLSELQEDGSGLRPETGQPRRRRRAFSENGQDEPRLQRVMSDGALEGIDVQATFSSSLLDHTGGLFLPSAFGPGSPEESDSEDYKEGGLNMFSDEEILASEDFGSDPWFMGGRPLRRPGRAMSDAQVIAPPLGHQKTWAGAESLHHFALLQAMRAKSNEWPVDEEKGTGTKSGGVEFPTRGLRRLSMAAINFFTPTNKLKKKKSTTELPKFPEEKQPRPRNDARHRLSLQEEDRNAINQELNYLTHMPEGRRPSLLDLFTSGRGSETPISPVLEQTSIADFIRVVHSLKAMEAATTSRPTSPSQQSRARGRSTSSMGPSLPNHLMSRLNERRYSQVPSGAVSPVQGRARPRAASIAPVLAGPVDRRLRRLSATPRASPHSSGRATPTHHHFRPFPAPSLVVTSPDGSHKFSIHSVDPASQQQQQQQAPVPPPPPLRRADTLKDFPNYRPM